MRWVTTTPELLHRVSLRPDQAAQDVRDLITEEHADILRESSRTLLDGEEPIASVGVIDFKGKTLGEDLTGMVWAAISEAAVGHPVELARGTRLWLEHAFERWGYRQICAVMAADTEYLERWAKFLGFEPMERMAGYMPDGRDAVLYLRDRENQE
jgi:hypothetical protein